MIKKYDINNTLVNIINDNINNFGDVPFFLINITEIINLYNLWIQKLPNIKPYYAIKCNTDNEIIKILSNLNCNFDVASINEIEYILKYVNSDRLIYANPCKSISSIIYCKNNNINLMTFDSIEELYKIKKYNENAKLILRIAVDDSKSLCKFNIKFGYNINNINDIINIINNLKLNLIGISFHVGSGCSSPKIYYESIKITKDIYNIAKKNNINISIIDIGGGFIKKLFNEISIEINNALNDFYYDELLNNEISFISEPGRFFIETSHTLILNVISKKKDNDIIKYYINDGIYGCFNCIINDHANPSFNLLKSNDNELYNSIIFGPTCDSIDIIKKNIILPELNIGDYLYVENFGAYTISASSKFNGFYVNNNVYYSYE